MALKGIESTKAALRATKLVYWRIFENARTKGAGSFIATSNFDDPDITQDESYRDLSEALDRLGGGRYVLMGYKKNTTHGGAQFESEFEVIPDYARSSSPISGTGSNFTIDGFGAVTSENFNDAVDFKIKAAFAKQQEEKKLADLEAEVKRLKDEAKENDGTINKGLLAIGTVLYPMVSKSPHFKEVFSMVSGVIKQANSATPVANALGSTTAAAPSTAAAEHIEGDTCEIGGVKVPQDDLFKTLDDLGTDNPDVLEHLKILSGLKKNNPAMYNEAVEMAKNL